MGPSAVAGQHMNVSGSAFSILEVLFHFWKCSLISGSALSFLKVLSGFWKCSLISAL